MKRPWMPLYIADYLRKTTHLGALESGAYLHLIMDYWQNEGLPDDDKKLARIAKMTDREWKAAKPTLKAFFHDGWLHEKINEEIAKASEISTKRSAIATARQAAIREQTDSKPSAIAPANADTLHTSHSKKDAAPAALSVVPEMPPMTAAELEKSYFDRGKEVLGKSGGGMIKNLLKAKQNNVALARAAIEQASTKSDPREYIGAVIRGQHKSSEPNWLDGIEGVI